MIKRFKKLTVTIFFIYDEGTHAEHKNRCTGNLRNGLGYAGMVGAKLHVKALRERLTVCFERREKGAQVAPTKDYQQAKHDSSPSCEFRNSARKLKKMPESHFLYMWRSTRAGLSKRNGRLGRPLPPASGGLSMGFILACVSAPVLAAAGAALPKSLAESRAARNQPNTPTTAWELARGNLRLGPALINCAKSGGGKNRQADMVDINASKSRNKSRNLTELDA
jgi:hypothetical protein